MTVSRKSITDALLKLLAPDGGVFKTSGKRLRDPETVAALNSPALFLIKPNENYNRGDSSMLPPRRVLDVFAIIYTNIGDNQDTVPSDVVDDLLDAIDTAMTPSGADLPSGRQTLGGLVNNCIISGDLDLAPGDVQGRGTVVIPIKIMLP